MQPDGIIETVLYTRDMAASRTFFEGVLGLTPHNSDERFTAYPVGPSMLLIFQQGQTDETVRLPDGMGTIPPHNGGGEQHIALAIGADMLQAWETRLAEHGIAIEGRTHWPPGGESVYFRDPDRHLIELVTPGLWPNY
ncbi:glyoxalase/bleomycin resistance protein/dioxygenase superfamily protein [Kushneria sinocarnis]|uniref:Glyoxalase/bleomycin resistance protein/dioxygenase superfamily protein n=1 Tax=Kushneria sinocarnis TaxID=595502 RepID=A0A420WXR5_9GAMM|nr:VOC family protein [Kushneria sinocarnis]RKR04510.1 glyoxalase/bleomycin resistance protein/dioxygenase superfamily protein [Kushneria sinocarnis]